MFVFLHQIKDTLKKSPAKENRALLTFVGISFLLNLALWLIILLKLRPEIDAADQMIPLHYNIYFGIDYLGPWYYAFILPALGLFLLAINTFISFLIYIKEKILSYFLVGTAFFSQIILLGAGILVVLINSI